MFRNKSNAWILSICIALAGGSVQAASLAVPLNGDGAPANDLVYENEVIDSDSALDLRHRGLDLSALNPLANDVWQDKKYTSSDADAWNYPSEGATVKYQGRLDASTELMRGQVLFNNQIFRINVSLRAHAALARAALLRKLGYPVQSPKSYRRLKISFSSIEERDNFYRDISAANISADHERWVIEKSDDSTQITVQDVVLEPGRIIVPTAFYWGNINPEHLKGRRALRSLIIPYVMFDVTESVNLFSPEAGTIISENAVLTHLAASSFRETTLDDVRWILRRLAPLSRQELAAVVAEGQYPADIAALLTEKIIARRNSLMALFGMQKYLEPQQLALPVNLEISVGKVVKGKATQERYDGYAQRFTWGDPKSPLQSDEIVKFLRMEFIGVMLKQLTSEINVNLELWSMDELFQKRSESLRANFFEHIRNNPGKPYSQPLSVWHGPTGGPILSAGRHITTGTYYGSDSPVQLVDSIAVGAKVGYFLGLDGVPNVFPGVGANIGVQRNYVHVRPVPSITAGSKEEWDRLWIPGFMKDLGGVLEQNGDPNDSETERKEKLESSLTKFLEELKEGEIFIITDSLNLGAQVSANIPITALLALDPLAFSNSLVFGVNGNVITLRRTTFMRDGGKIKIYLQHINQGTAGVSVDFNFWMNIARMSYEKKYGEAHTRAFHLPEKPSEEADMNKVMQAVRGVLVHNNTESLENNFYPYELDHAMKADVINGKFLFWRWTNLEETHKVKVRPPYDPNHGFNPADHQRTLFSHKRMDRKGKNYYTFLSDVIDGLVQTSEFFHGGLLGNNSGGNPANSFMGNSKWRIVTTEAEITPGREQAPVTLLENYWAGWNVSKKNLFKILDGVDKRVQSMNLGIPLVDRNVFSQMHSLQLYELRTTLIIYDDAMAQIRDLLFNTQPTRGSVFRRMVGWDDYSSTDKQVYDYMVELYGKKEFAQICKEAEEYKVDQTRTFRPAQELEGFHINAYWYGVNYKCLAPWQVEILRARRKYPTDREGQVKWTTRVVDQLESNIDLARLIRWLGPENMFFQVKISGFRNKDENGDSSEYVSNSIGTFDNRERAGIFREFATEYEITAHEMYAKYLSEAN